MNKHIYLSERRLFMSKKRDFSPVERLEDHVSGESRNLLDAFGIEHGHRDRQRHNAMHHGPKRIAVALRIPWLHHPFCWAKCRIEKPS
jgi:hypothetical protein